jgi:hypothetical protein
MATHGWETHWHKHPGVRAGDQLTLGERAADRMRNMMGSWPFVFCFFGIMIAWAVANSAFYLGGQHGKHGFDPVGCQKSTMAFEREVLDRTRGL